MTVLLTGSDWDWVLRMYAGPPGAVQGWSDSPSPHVASRPIPRTQSTPFSRPQLFNRIQFPPPFSPGRDSYSSLFLLQFRAMFCFN